jgi:Uma2 family endonuclease
MSRPAGTERYRFTTEAYFRMAEVGILADDERVELLDGEIIELSPPGYRHAAVVSRLNSLFAPLAGRRVIVRVQDPLVLSRFSAPQPDIALVRYADDFHAHGHPRGEDVLLAVEVSDSTVRKDLAWKARIYAAAGIPEYWVVDLTTDRVVVHTSPGSHGYGSQQAFSRADSLAATAIPGAEWTVDEILGPP